MEIIEQFRPNRIVIKPKDWPKRLHKILSLQKFKAPHPDEAIFNIFSFDHSFAAIDHIFLSQAGRDQP
ncbi:MAG: hypothetical protein K8F24_11580 [Bacteroidales bacterium]|nr:hypothetical protein [Bacteroidales bacterium]